MNADLFERAPVPRAYFTLALPLVLSMTVTLVYNLVDTYFIAHTGNEAMVAGVSIATPVFTLMIALGDIFGLGGASVISRLFGEGRLDEARRVSAFCFWAATAFGILVMIVMLTAEAPILRLLGATPETVEYASQYYRWIVIGSPVLILALTPSNLLRTEGFATASMIGTVGGALINIVLNPILISVVGWGAAGSAIATVSGNVFAVAYFAWFTRTRSQRLSIAPRLARIPARLLLAVFAIGLPASVTNLMQSAGIILLHRFLLPFGTTSIAAMGIVLKITMVAVLILVGFSFGAQPLIGYAYGARDIVRLRQILRFCYAFECSLAVVLSLALALPARHLMGFFISDPGVIAAGEGMLRLQVSSMVCVTVVLITTVTFQSLGKAAAALVLSISRQGVALLAVLAVCAPLFGYRGVIAAQPFTDLLTAALALGLLVIVWRGDPRLREDRRASLPLE